MRWGSGLVNLFYNVAIGKGKTRVFLTPVGEVFYFGLIVLFITISFWIDKLFQFPKLLPGFLGVCVSIPVIAVGVFLMTWSVLCFFKARGTPVSFNPPPRLITTGPYAHISSPMLTGIFIWLLGLGILFTSFSLVFATSIMFIPD